MIAPRVPGSPNIASFHTAAFHSLELCEAASEIVSNSRSHTTQDSSNLPTVPQLLPVNAPGIFRREEHASQPIVRVQRVDRSSVPCTKSRWRGEGIKPVLGRPSGWWPTLSKVVQIPPQLPGAPSRPDHSEVSMSEPHPGHLVLNQVMVEKVIMRWDNAFCPDVLFQVVISYTITWSSCRAATQGRTRAQYWFPGRARTPGATSSNIDMCGMKRRNMPARTSSVFCPEHGMQTQF